MKLVALFILSVLSREAFGQAKQLNKLLKEYGYTWNKQLPIALQNSKELVVPSLIGIDEISIIKWSDIDSVRIFDIREGSIHVYLYGRIIKYRKCKTSDSSNAKYLDTAYCTRTIDDRERLVFKSKTEDEKLALSNKVRKKLRKAFYQLNKNPVTENYRPRLSKIPAAFNHKTKEIVLHLTYEEKLVLPAKDLQDAKKIAISYIDLTSKITHKIVSFDLYIVNEGIVSTLYNQGASFNDSIIALLRNAQPGTTLTFDNIKVEVEENKIRIIGGFTLIAK